MVCKLGFGYKNELQKAGKFDYPIPIPEVAKTEPEISLPVLNFVS